jgi:ubiquitin-protein ligase
MSEYSSKTLKRIMSEVRNIEKCREEMAKSGLYIFYNPDSVGKFYFLIIGTDGTPYERGFYPFSLEIPARYPFEPPKVQIILPNDGKSRMNPNLYIGGKVCLSMINTWAGPGWLPSYTIEKVVIAIQALVMNDNPLVNEPGHENDNQVILDEYNDAVLHQNYVLAIIRMYSSLDSGCFTYFKEVVLEKFKENKDFYVKQLEKYVEKYKDVKVFRTRTYGMRINNDYKNILDVIKGIGEIK